jgi:hypothetical protein
LCLGLLIRHEGINALAKGLHAWLIQNRLAEFPRLPGYRSFFNRRFHIQFMLLLADTGTRPLGVSAPQYNTSAAQKQTFVRPRED